MFLKNSIKKVVTKALNDNDTIFFLTNDARKKYKKYFAKHKVYVIENTKEIEEIGKSNDTAIIFIESYNDTSILQANKIAKCFKDSEKYDKVFVLALECSEKDPVPLYAILNEDNSFGSWNDKTKQLENAYFDALFTTNSTGVLEPQNIKGLLVIDVSQELKQDKIKQQKFQKYSDKCFDFLGYPLSAMAHCFLFMIIISNLHDCGIIKQYNTFNIITTMILSGFCLWIGKELSFVIYDYIAKNINIIDKSDMILDKSEHTETENWIIMISFLLMYLLVLEPLKLLLLLCFLLNLAIMSVYRIICKLIGKKCNIDTTKINNKIEEIFSIIFGPLLELAPRGFVFAIFFATDIPLKLIKKVFGLTFSPLISFVKKSCVKVKSWFRIKKKEY